MTAADVDVTHLDEILPDLDQPKLDRFVALAEGDIAIRQPATLPEKFPELQRANPRFALAWERRRPDLHDQSLSGYEMSLSSIAACNGWSAQEICNLLNVFRAKEGGRWHGRSYFRATISKALAQALKHRRDRLQGAFAEDREPESSADESNQGPASGAGENEMADDRSHLLAKLNRAHMFEERGLRIMNVVRRGSGYYAFDDSGHEIHLGTVREMNAFYLTQANIAEATGINLSIPSSKKTTYWYPVVEVLVKIAQRNEVAFEYGLEIDTRAHLKRALNALLSRDQAYGSRVEIHEEYLWKVNRAVRNCSRDEFLRYDDQARKQWPQFAFWTTDKRLWVHAPTLETYLGTPCGGNDRRITADLLKQGFALMGFAIDKVVTGQRGEAKTSERWCISPTGFELDPDCNPQPGLRPDVEPKAPEHGGAM